MTTPKISETKLLSLLEKLKKDKNLAKSLYLLEEVDSEDPGQSSSSQVLNYGNAARSKKACYDSRDPVDGKNPRSSKHLTPL